MHRQTVSILVMESLYPTDIPISFVAQCHHNNEFSSISIFVIPLSISGSSYQLESSQICYSAN